MVRASTLVEHLDLQGEALADHGADRADDTQGLRLDHLVAAHTVRAVEATER